MHTIRWILNEAHSILYIINIIVTLSGIQVNKQIINEMINMVIESFEKKILNEFDKLGVANKLTYRELDEFNKIQNTLTGKIKELDNIRVDKPNRVIFNFQEIGIDFVILFNTGTTGVEIIDSTYFIVHDHILEFYNCDDVCIGVYPVELIKELIIL